MRVFVTGASGYIGQAVAEAFRRKGHWVAGMVRSEAKRRPLEAREIRTFVGDLKTSASYLQFATESDVWVHAAAEWGNDTEAIDRQTVHALLELGRQSDRTHAFIYTSGVWLYGNTGNKLVNESHATESTSFTMGWRQGHEKKVLEASDRKIRGVVIRPGVVYGGRGGLTGSWFESARKKGAAQMVGEGTNRWATIHVDDLARLYVQAAEKRISGELLNATDRSRFTVQDMASSASRAAEAGGRVSMLAADEAKKTMGPIVDGLMLDQHVDSSKAVQMLGWQPRFGGFPENAARYFQSWRAAQSDK